MILSLLLVLIRQCVHEISQGRARQIGEELLLQFSQDPAKEAGAEGAGGAGKRAVIRLSRSFNRLVDLEQRYAISFAVAEA